jgi:hypothetical protein
MYGELIPKTPRKHKNDSMSRKNSVTSMGGGDSKKSSSPER